MSNQKDPSYAVNAKSLKLADLQEAVELAAARYKEKTGNEAVDVWLPKEADPEDCMALMTEYNYNVVGNTLNGTEVRAGQRGKLASNGTVKAGEKPKVPKPGTRAKVVAPAAEPEADSVPAKPAEALPAVIGEWVDVESSNVRRWFYDPDDLYIWFNSEKVYVYFGVPESIVEGLVNAPSIGKYFHANIGSDAFEYEEVGIEGAPEYEASEEPETEIDETLADGEPDGYLLPVGTELLYRKGDKILAGVVTEADWIEDDYEGYGDVVGPAYKVLGENDAIDYITDDDIEAVQEDAVEVADSEPDEPVPDEDDNGIVTAEAIAGMEVAIPPSPAEYSIPAAVQVAVMMLTAQGIVPTHVALPPEHKTSGDLVPPGMTVANFRASPGKVWVGRA